MAAERRLTADLRRTADLHGGRTAVIDGSGALSYAELDAEVDVLAGALRAHGVRPGDAVAWCGSRSATAVAVVHAVLRAGAGYAPLDPDGPAGRAARLVERLRPRAVIADGPARSAWEAVGAGSSWSPLPTTGATELWIALVPEPRAVPAEQPAYVLHTSGSTGVPKGVVHTHDSAAAFVDWGVSELGLGPDDVLLNSAPLHFDLSTLDLFGACRVGAAVAVLPPSVAPFPAGYADFLRRSGATVWYTVPSALAWLTARGTELLPELKGLRAAVFAGEALRPADVDRLRTVLPGLRVWNWYGPTETNVCASYELPPDHGPNRPAPIGRAAAGAELLIVDDRSEQVADGEPGRLLVRGATLMAGYADGREVFVRTADGRTWYPTGDLVRRDADGLLAYLGRTDQQVKSRGYRIELGEVEALIGALPEVRSCVAVAVPDDLLGTAVVGFVRPAERPPGPSSGLAAAVRAALPSYLVPARLFVLTGDFPRLSSGKTDRAALTAGAVGDGALEGTDRVW
ncbi:amino acid adenylation domain-containing protein [Kitasatospora cineracea]|uniref:amino acid adenylation domain-containing protein n=1 Tax=Kitasatospora cineracea TaxID=88074 RepID=UPI00378FBD93